MFTSVSHILIGCWVREKQDYSLIESPKFYTNFIQIKHKLVFAILKNKNKNKLAIWGFVCIAVFSLNDMVLKVKQCWRIIVNLSELNKRGIDATNSNRSNSKMGRPWVDKIPYWCNFAKSHLTVWQNVLM